jgi:HTH-type transcriptional regulator, competence development regulator
MALFRLECGGAKIEIWEVDHGPPHCHISGLDQAGAVACSRPGVGWSAIKAGRSDTLVNAQICIDASRVGSEPDRVLVVRFCAIDSILWVQFGDGLERAVRWSDLPFAREVGLVPATASAGFGGESVVLVNEVGTEITVDAGSLRACLDEQYRAKLESEDDSERKIVGARIRAVRESASLSQQELSRRSGIAQESLSRIETGRRDPRLGTLRRLAKGLGLSLDQLMERLSATT